MNAIMENAISSNRHQLPFFQQSSSPSSSSAPTPTNHIAFPAISDCPSSTASAVFRYPRQSHFLLHCRLRMEEEQSQSRPLRVPSSSSGDAGASSSSSSPPSQLHEESEAAATEVQVQLHPPDDVTADLQDLRSHRDRRRVTRQESPRRSVLYRINFTISNFLPHDGDEIWSCLAVLVTFWFFASMTLILGFYGSYSMQLGPNCSQLITANELFVQSIVGQQTEGSSGPMLYGFHSSPALDVETTWSETRNASVESDFHKEWMYYLNAGSKVEISYDVKNTSSSLSLVIAQGEESLIEWIEDPSYPNITLSWNTIYGSGSIEQDITSSDSYYVAVGNLDSNTIEVQLNLTIKAVLYNTTEAFYKCSVYNKACRFSCFFLKKNAVIITSPGPEQVKDDEDFYVRVSYGPRWLTYILGSGILTIVVLLLFRICNFFQPSHLDGTQTGREADNQEPLISPKDDDLSSWGSSYDSVSNDDEDLDEWIHGQGNQQPTEEGENSANPRKLCVICFDSPRDCFFLPCGHCAACFTCGSRIAEEAGTCPICRRRMKKVRKIFSV